LASPLVSGGLCELTFRVVAVILEAVEPALVHQDAAEEKLKLCKQIASSLSKTVVQVLVEAEECFGRPRLSLVLRILAVLLRVSHHKVSLKGNLEEWNYVLSKAVEAAVSSFGDSQIESASKKFLIAALSCQGDLKSNLPKRFQKNLWKKVIDCQGEAFLNDTTLLMCLLEAFSVKDLENVLQKQLQTLVRKGMMA